MDRVWVEGKAAFARKAAKIMRDGGFTLSRRPEFVVAVGGDGTAIAAIRKRGVPVLPVRAGPSMGFIADVPLESLGKAGKKILGGDYNIEMLPVAELRRNGRRVGPVVNDAVVRQRDPRHAARFSVYAGGNVAMERVIGDGVIIATGMGSAAYNRAAGGLLLKPGHPGLVVTLNNAVACPRRSFIAKAGASIKIKLHGRQGYDIALDGITLHRAASDDEITVTMSGKTFGIVRPRGMREAWQHKLERRAAWLCRR